MGTWDLIGLGAGWPNIEYLLLPTLTSYNPSFPTPPNAMGNYLMALIALVLPTSHHSMGMASTSIDDLPIIDVNYFVTLANCNIVVQGLKNALILAASDVFWCMFLCCAPLSMSVMVHSLTLHVPPKPHLHF